ncbi:MAG: hypothetical protein KAF27_08980, partial [Porphyrobacter sp.]|nr:hypothetical protein [Porphyrobacter sp.]
MSQAVLERSRLLSGAAGAALAMGLMLGGTPAAAQGILADGNVVAGSAEISTIDATTTSVDVFSPTAVINWTPQVDNSGNALNFLRAGATAIFRAAQGENFAVLNRILPGPNNNIVVINGNVLSQVIGVTGAPVPGGFIAFYSPTGILVGENATFDVGSLLLSTLDMTNNDFEAFALQGALLPLNGAPGSTARIDIRPGAQINALPENAFFAVVAADIEMRGAARVNGSHAYVAGEVVNLRFSNGLFDISVPVGTAAGGEVLTLDGTIGGPSSTGAAGDNHLIYAVARASQDPISMLFRGNLGFDPAQTAGVINGEIILSANHNVSGRTVDGGSIRDGNAAIFNGNSALAGARADILIEDIAASSSLLAISAHSTRMRAIFANSSVAGNLQLIGREGAFLSATGGRNLAITGNALISASDLGVGGSSPPDPNAINADAGQASLLVSPGASATIGGDLLVSADALAGAETIAATAGTARAGLADITVQGGTLNVRGTASVSARA